VISTLIEPGRALLIPDPEHVNSWPSGLYMASAHCV